MAWKHGEPKLDHTPQEGRPRNDSGHPEGECCRVPGRIFVFGSNIWGIHGAGAAAHAHKSHGAISRVGVGRQGGSYAIPTVKYLIPHQSLDLDVVRLYVNQFIEYAFLIASDEEWLHGSQPNPPVTEFLVTKVGCGLAGFSEDEIAPLFRGAPSNCLLPDGWR